MDEYNFHSCYSVDKNNMVRDIKYESEVNNKDESMFKITKQYANHLLQLRAVPENVFRGVSGNKFFVRYPVVKIKKFVRRPVV